MSETLVRINHFLSRKRIAVVGVSRNPRDFSAMLFRDLAARGYDVVPVNPAATEVEGRTSFARVQDIQPPVEAALLMTPAGLTDQVVRDCAEAGIETIWMYRAGGRGAVSPAAVAFCESRGIQVIPGLCPYMFLSGTAFFHRVHRFFVRIPATPAKIAPPATGR